MRTFALGSFTLGNFTLGNFALGKAFDRFDELAAFFVAVPEGSSFGLRLSLGLRMR